ncbi:hypothetical protein TIFTF001_030186 [Ficus carica]|uniref:RNase H type-1 domain-containing protein n=1 Tax=Ficus carica TaxID=3494 RepID=A0AA88DX46_FICCA|nr:hypothetical protein TIFTF001_030186 [Ficus carica]
MPDFESRLVSLSIGLLIVKKSGIPFADVLWQLAFDLSKVDLAFFCWMSWRQWGERNNTSHGKVISSPESILELGMAGLGEWSNLSYESPMEHGITEGTDAWLPPLPGILKLNVDAAMISSANFVGVGGIVRDHDGFVCVTLAKTILSSFGPFTAECIALQEGLTFVRDLGLLIHAVENDVLNVITAVQGVPSLDDTGVVLDDVPKVFVWALMATTTTVSPFHLNSFKPTTTRNVTRPESRRLSGTHWVRCVSSSGSSSSGTGIAESERVTVKNGNDSLEICRVLNGMWQTSGGWGRIDRNDAVDAMLLYADSGLSTFDMADH